MISGQQLRSIYFKKPVVFYWLYNKTKTCAIMEREARKVQEQEHTGNMKREIALCNHAKHAAQEKTNWKPVASRGFPWHPVASRGFLWHPVASCGLLGRFGWPRNGKMALAQAGAPFCEFPGGLLSRKVALACAVAGFSGPPRGRYYLWPGCGCSKTGVPSPPTALAKAKK